jgi:hypothetical protein
MKRHLTLSIASFLFNILFCLNSFSQADKYIFIQPNVSLRYDSLVFRNPVKYGDNREYSFSYANSKGDKTFISIRPDKSDYYLSQREQDSFAMEAKQGIKKTIPDSILLKSCDIIHYKGFTGTGIHTAFKNSAIQNVTIYVRKYFHGGFVQCFTP